MRNKFYEDYPALIYRLYPEKSKVLDVTIQVTDACNLKCSYCYQINKGHHYLDVTKGKKFIDILLNNSKNLNKYTDVNEIKGIILNFIGGEPFLAIDCIDELTTYFINQLINKKHPWLNFFRIGIASNGTLYFDPKVQSYLRKFSKFVDLMITIDGNKQLHDSCRVFPDGTGSYDLAIQGVQHYQKNYEHMSSKMTISPENVYFINDAIINLINLHYEDINLNCAYEDGWNNQLATILYQQLKQISDYILENNLENKLYISMFREDGFCPKDKRDLENWCGGNGQMLALDWKGDIYPCIRFMESSLGPKIPPIILGNVDDGLLFTQWQQDICFDLQKVNRINQSSDECLNCPVAESCGWCQGFNYQDGNGNLYHRATYICPMHKATSLANVYYWNKYYQKNNINKKFIMYLPENDALEIIDKNEYNMLKNLQQ